MTWSINPTLATSTFNYLIFSEGVDGGELRSYKSTEAYNYLHSNKIGKVLLKKAAVTLVSSHSVSQAKYTAWIMLKESGVVETGSSSCIVGFGKSCSHAAAILWKMFINPKIYFSAKAASNASLRSSFLSMAFRAQGTCLSKLLMYYTRRFWKKPQFSWIVLATNNGSCCTWAHFKNNLAHDLTLFF